MANGIKLGSNIGKDLGMTDDKKLGINEGIALDTTDLMELGSIKSMGVGMVDDMYLGFNEGI
eukprot:4269381-Ditylum_brightwellii.AAC.1